MARGRKRGRGGSRTDRALPEPDPEPIEDVDDEDLAFQEAIRLSQLEAPMTEEERRKREEEELEQAIQLSLRTSSGDEPSTSARPSTCNDESVPSVSILTNCSNSEDSFLTPSSSKQIVKPYSLVTLSSGSEVYVTASEKSHNDSVEIVGESGTSNRKASPNSVEINLCDEDSRGSNGCDSTVSRNRRGVKNGLETAAMPVVNRKVSSTRGRRGRRRAAEPIASVSRNVPQVIDVDSDVIDDDDSDDSNVRDAVSILFDDNDDISSGDEYAPDATWGGEVCSSTTQVRNGANRDPTPSGNIVLNNAEIGQRMKSLFETSLKLHLTGEYMKACEAVKTPLYPHQMYALAWMSKRENHPKLEMCGGILADDMGLGKTLTILALVLTNFHEEKPMAKPQFGFRRKLCRSALRYMPSTFESTKTSRANDDKENGAKQKRGATSGKNRTGAGATRKKDVRQKVKTTRLIDSSGDSDEQEDNYVSSYKAAAKAVADSSLQLDLDADDEFDAMCGEQSSLAEKVGVTPDSAIFARSKVQFFDDLSDDEEYQNMTEEERNKMMKPKLDIDLNIDGCCRDIEEFVDTSNHNSSSTSGMNINLNLDGASRNENSDSDFEEPCSSSNLTSRGKKRANSNVCPEPRKKKDRVVSPSLLDDADSSPARSDSLLDNDEDVFYELPDLEGAARVVSPVASPATPSLRPMMELTAEQKKNLKIPPKQIASCNGRRRATLIVTPASLIGQWLSQIEMHVHKNVNLDIFVHHGMSKSLIALELQDKDIVFTTYGTLMAEFKEDMHGPLLRAKWLRVVLDEGHQIKNHRSKTFKAASHLDTLRKWIVSGTPIQNNLTELWALLNWLGEPNFGKDRPRFKTQIEAALKRGHPRGVERLQVLMETICLRRTKQDEVNGRPLVSLPTKTVTLKQLDFNPEEKTIYDAYHKQGRDLIMKYMSRGTLLKNYGHVFAVMMRLRQLCCHRELLPVKWQDVDMNELTAMAAADITPLDDAPNGGSEMGEYQHLAESLRKMIKDGMSDECSICLSEFDHPVITPCAHIYCRPCITQHIQTAPPPATCPLCRGNIKLTLLLEAALDEEIDEGAKADDFKDIVVELSSTKVNAVLRELEIARRKNPGEKSIVVSQFTSFLSILQPLLTQEGYNWSRLDGSMSIRDRLGVIEEFQSPSKDSPTILLLSLRAGGVGLNLTAANRLYLLDPAWNPSTEEQCFDRIHRLGQLKNVEVVKFVMKDSIEERMLQIQDKKKDLISGAFRQTEHERREQRIQDIRDIFDL